MIRKFFHNRHDATSRERLAQLDPGALVYDVYSGEFPNYGRDLLDEYGINRLPYYIDREVILLSPDNPAPGTFTLEFEVRDYTGARVVEPLDVFLTWHIAGESIQNGAQTDTGLFAIDVTCSTAMDITLRITDYNADNGIDLFESVIHVGG